MDKIAAAAAVAAVPVAVTKILKRVGFGADGIGAGSCAAVLMSSYGGTVPAGSLCSVMQSIGAKGISAVAVWKAVAAVLAAASAFFRFKGKSDTPPKGSGTNSTNADVSAAEDRVDPVPSSTEEEEEALDDAAVVENRADPAASLHLCVRQLHVH